MAIFLFLSIYLIPSLVVYRLNVSASAISPHTAAKKVQYCPQENALNFVPSVLSRLHLLCARLRPHGNCTEYYLPTNVERENHKIFTLPERKKNLPLCAGRKKKAAIIIPFYSFILARRGKKCGDP